MSTKTGTSLRVSRVINASPARVFDAWTEPDQLKQWSSPEGGYTVEDVQVDLTVGGRYRIGMVTPDGNRIAAYGVYRKIERPKRLVYTWDWDGEAPLGETLVTVEFNDLGGSTEVVINHERFPNAEAKQGHEDGWTSCLNKLELVFK